MQTDQQTNELTVMTHSPLT